MISTYAENRGWSDRHIQSSKQVLGQIFGPLMFEVASEEQDTKEATDLVMLRTRDLKFALRFRRPGDYDRNPNCITIRSKPRFGDRTEIHKIKEGHGDYFFYGHSDGEWGFSHYFLINLHKLRKDMTDRRNQLKYRHCKNKDGSEFIAFDVRSFSTGVVVLRK